eukprot:1070786-Rhodomonas_salina.1
MCLPLRESHHDARRLANRKTGLHIHEVLSTCIIRTRSAHSRLEQAFFAWAAAARESATEYPRIY